MINNYELFLNCLRARIEQFENAPDLLNIDESEVYWIDEIGDKFEKQGVDRANIFEFSEKLTEDCIPGGIVETTGGYPNFYNIKRIVIKLRDNCVTNFSNMKEASLIEMSPNRPVFVANMHKIKEFF